VTKFGDCKLLKMRICRKRFPEGFSGTGLHTVRRVRGKTFY